MVFPGSAGVRRGGHPAVAVDEKERCTAVHACARPCSSQRWSIIQGFQELRDLRRSAHRHHGRRPLPDRTHETGRAPICTCERDHHRLRHDRDQPDQRFRATPPTLLDKRRVDHGRQAHPSPCRRSRSSARTAAPLFRVGVPGRIAAPAAIRVMREILERCGKAPRKRSMRRGWMHSAGDLATIDAMRAIATYRRPGEGHADPRRREHLSRAKSRSSCSAHPDRSSSVQVFGVPDQTLSARKICAWIILHDGQEQRPKTRSAHFCEGRDRPLQDPSIYQIRNGVSDDGNRQGAEIRHARNDGE